ncbi:MAG: P-loop containing nucleoside triphosphate hydrolase protein, partial [Podila humilis]
EDCILIARCGWGKSLIYFLPLALWKDRTIVVISPLLALMHEQQEKLQVSSFKAICLDSSQAIDVGLLCRLDKGEFRCVFMMLESILSVGKSSGQGKSHMDSLWGMSGWRERLQAIVIDETHCVSSWGKDFRKAYACLRELHGIAPAHVTFVAMSATLPGPILREIKQSIRFCDDVPVYNVSNNRPNVRLEVRFLPHKNIFQVFDFLLDDVQKTIIYFDSQNDIQDVQDYLQNLRSTVANDQWDIIKSFHSLYSDEYKSTTLKLFREGRIKILLSTEAAGMGCDISDVVHVVQFKEPSTISC